MNDKPKEYKVRCPCGARMKLKYSKKYKKHFYGCEKWPDCRNTHGAHPDGRPLGKPADKETRDLRRMLHIALDKYYPLGSYGRYCERSRFLQNATGKYHIANLEKGQIKQLLYKLGYKKGGDKK